MGQAVSHTPSGVLGLLREPFAARPAILELPWVSADKAQWPYERYSSRDAGTL